MMLIELQGLKALGSDGGQYELASESGANTSTGDACPL